MSLAARKLHRFEILSKANFDFGCPCGKRGIDEALESQCQESANIEDEEAFQKEGERIVGELAAESDERGKMKKIPSRA